MPGIKYQSSGKGKVTAQEKEKQRSSEHAQGIRKPQERWQLEPAGAREHYVALSDSRRDSTSTRTASEKVIL